MPPVASHLFERVVVWLCVCARARVRVCERARDRRRDLRRACAHLREKMSRHTLLNISTVAGMALADASPALYAAACHVRYCECRGVAAIDPRSLPAALPLSILSFVKDASFLSKTVTISTGCPTATGNQLHAQCMPARVTPSLALTEALGPRALYPTAPLLINNLYWKEACASLVRLEFFGALHALSPYRNCF